MKKFFLLCLTTLICSTATCLAGTLIDGIYYNINSSRRTLAVTYFAYQSEDNGQAYYGDIVIPEKVTYSGAEYTVTSISEFAFAYCYDLTSLTLPETITSIDRYAFWYCDHLKSVNIPDAVTYFGPGAFWGCSVLEEVNIPYGITTLYSHTFRSCLALEKADIPDTVTLIESYAFYECSGLKSLTMGDNVEEIQAYTFTGCSSLESITIPDKVTSTPPGMCKDCTSLKTATLGASVEEVGTAAFQDCTSLKELYLYNPEPPTVGGNTFLNVSIKRATLYVPAGTRDTYRAADTWCDFYMIKEMEDPDSDGISSVSVDTSEIESIYSTSGQKLNSTVKGVNIIRYSDGTTKKVLIYP